MKVAILLVISSCILSGCMGLAPGKEYTPVRSEISEPPIGSVNESYVGDYMLQQGNIILHDAIILNEDIELGKWGMTRAYKIKSGWYLKEADDKKGKGAFYRPSFDDAGGEIQVGPMSDGYTSAIYVSNSQRNIIGIVYYFNSRLIGETEVEFERTKKVKYRSDSFQQTLIYSGRVGDKINISYREFSHNSARPSYNNDVEYDLSTSKIIRYKGAKLEVLDATNESIKYKVLSNFNKATL